MSVEITPAPVTLGRVSDWYAWCDEYLHLADRLDEGYKLHRERLNAGPLKRGDKTLEEKPEDLVTVSASDLAKALRDREAVIRLAGILFLRSDGQPIGWEDCRERITEEMVVQGFFGFGGASQTVSALLTSSALGSM